MATTYVKRLKSWFFTTTGDTMINGFWTRFKGRGISKPQEETMSDLVASSAFHADADSIAAVDSNTPWEEKSGLVAISTDAKAKAGLNTLEGATIGVTVVQPSHLPNVIDSTTNQILREFTGKPLEVVTDATGTNNKYSFLLRSTFLTTLLKYLLPSFVVGDANKIVALNAAGTNYELIVAPTGGGGGDSYKTTSVTPVNIGTVTLGTSVPITVASSTLAYTQGQYVALIDAATPANFITGFVTSYSGTTLTVKVTTKGGTGTPANLNVNLSGQIVPDYTAVTTKSQFVVENGIVSYQPIGSGSNNQFWIAPGGSDISGDGSINAPWQTFSKAKTEIQSLADSTGDTVTLMVIGGAYSNDVNMAVSRLGTTHYNYTINCFPGVNITQSTTSFYDNETVIGHIDVYGSPNITGSGTLGGAYLINIATKRNVSTQTIQYHRYKNLSVNNVTAKCVKIGFTAANNFGPSICYFSAATVNSGVSTPAVEVMGADTSAILQIGNATNNVSGGVGVLLNGAGSAIITDSRLANQISGTLFKGFEVSAPPAWNATWGSGNGAGINPSYIIKDTTVFVRASTSACCFIDVTGAGDLSTKLLIDSCSMFTEPASNSAVFVAGTSIADKLCIVNSISSADASSGSPDIVALGTAATLSVDTTKTFYILPQFPF